MRNLIFEISRFSTLLLAGLLLGCESDQNVPPTEAEMKLLSSPMDNTPFMSPGIENPLFVSAEDAEIAPEAEIIGVVFETQSFAFPLRQLTGMRDHVVNHVVDHGDGQVPLSVTFCDMNDCVRVLSSREATGSLKISTVGRSQGEMLLQFDDRRFLQSADGIPLEDVPFERTTFERWLELHPDSKIYVGRAESGNLH